MTAADEPLSASVRMAVLKALMDQIKTAYEDARREADDQLRSLYREASATQMVIVVPGMGKVAKLSLAVADAKVVLNDAKLLAWVREREPEQIRQHVVKTDYVLATFLAELVADLQIEDDGSGGDMVVRKSTGEVVEWARVAPGGPGQTTLTFEKGGRDAIAVAFRSFGQLLPKLPGAGWPRVTDVPAEAVVTYDLNEFRAAQNDEWAKEEG